MIDCRNVPREVCLDDQRMLEAMATGARKAGANVISQVRYHFGHNSPPGFTAVVVLDESHCSAHTYADLGLIALDVFTCGSTHPADVLKCIREEIDLGDVTVRELPRFPLDENEVELLQETAAASY
ncbi:MAG: S-adenosylmethionine decarboxylase proenzyme [Planctomyces sp.]|nr:S-adenosylmethionine decarboxylase proenzyme [Planctomyces sp.]